MPLLTQEEKRAVFVSGVLLLAINLSAMLIGIAYQVPEPVLGVLVIDFVMVGLASLIWLSHVMFPGRGVDNQTDPDATVEISSLRK